MSFRPKFDILPEPQKKLWPELAEVPKGFVLYGGTALALRLGHRQSVDFDFFASVPIHPDALLSSLSILRSCVVRQKSADALTVTVERNGPVKLSFFGVTIGRVGDPEVTEDGVLRVATRWDVAGCKMAAIQSRSEAKDYLDIHAVLKDGMPLAEMLAAARAIYGDQFAPMISLKSLTNFEDGDLPSLPEAVRSDLRRAASAVRDIPEFDRLPGGVSPESV